LLTAIAFITYFFIFRITIVAMNIQTPGREEIQVSTFTTTESVINYNIDLNDKYAVQANKILLAVGRNNIIKIDNCATRLRLTLKDNKNIDEVAIKAA